MFQKKINSDNHSRLPANSQNLPHPKKPSHNSSNQEPHYPLLDKLIRLHLYLLIFLIPLLFWPDTLTVFTIPKLLILRTLSISSGIFILLKLFLTDKVNFRFSKSYIFLGFWLISLILSTVFTLDLNSSLFGQYGRYLGIFTMFNFLLIPVFIVNFFTPAQTKKLLILSIFASTLAALYGLFQYFNFFGLIKFPYDWSDSPQNRVFGTFGHANHLGGYLAAHALILIFYPGYNWLKKQTVLAKIVYPIILLLHLTTLVLTASRGALLALILGLLICLCAAFFLRPKGYTGKNKKFQIISITIILLVLISASLYAARDSLSELGIFKRTEATVETINKGKIPDRLSFLYSALAMFVDHPITGTGLSTFRDAYSAYRRADYYIDGPGNAQFITVPEAAHDEYANVLATQGVIGFLAYLLLIGAAFRILIINIRKVEDLPSDFSRNYYLALLGGLSAYLIQTIFNFGEINNLFLFYLLLGLIFSTDTIFQISFSIRGMAAKTAEIIFIFVMLVLLAFVFNYGVINEGQADFYLKNAKQDDLNRNYTQAEKDYQLAIAARPQEYSIYQLYGDFLLSISAPSSDTIMLQRAIDNYQEVIRLNNNYPSTYHNLGLAYLQMYRLTKKPLYGELAKKAYQLSVDKAPNNPRYPYEYARILHSDFNDPAAAIALLKQAIAIDPDYQEPHDYLDFIYKNYPALR